MSILRWVAPEAVKVKPPARTKGRKDQRLQWCVRVTVHVHDVLMSALTSFYGIRAELLNRNYLEQKRSHADVNVSH